MEEAVQATFVAPAPWVETYQRAQCDGSAALRTFQSLIVDEIVLPESALEAKDPTIIVGASIAFVNSMLNEAMLLPGEFAQEALWGFYAHDYVTQVAQGGHVQYFKNRGDDELALRCTQSGLNSMIADPHLALFTEFVRLKQAEPKQARKTAAKAGFRTVEAAIRDLDRRLGELEQSEPLTPRHATWLKSLRKLRVTPDHEVSAYVARIASANPLREARLREAARARTDQESIDPAVIAAKALCEQAGLRFAGLRVGGALPMREVWREGPNRPAYALRVETSGGPRAALFYTEGALFKRYLAVLVEHDAPLPAGSLSLSRAEYAAIVPGV
jgi:hypothetical protein